MDALENLYREIILDHYRSPRHRGELEVPPAHRAEGFNPMCGDEVVITLEIDDPSRAEAAVVTELRVGGQGCSISQASASMMSDAVIGHTVQEIRDITSTFKAMMSIHQTALDGEEDPDPDALEAATVSLGELAALRGVVKFPVRIKCATLSWNTLAHAISDALDEAD